MWESMAHCSVAAWQVVLGGTQKQAEQVTENKPIEIVTHDLSISCCLQVLTLTTLTERKPFLPKLVLVAIFITAAETHPGHMQDEKSFLQFLLELLGFAGVRSSLFSTKTQKNYQLTSLQDGSGQIGRVAHTCDPSPGETGTRRSGITFGWPGGQTGVQTETKSLKWIPLKAVACEADISWRRWSEERIKPQRIIQTFSNRESLGDACLKGRTVVWKSSSIFRQHQWSFSLIQ